MRGRPDLSSLASLGNQPRDRLWVTTTFLGHTSARRAASHAMHIRLYPPAKLAFVLLTVAGASIAAADVERPVSARRVVPTTPLGGSRSPLSPRCGPDSDDVPLTNATGAISDGSGPGLYLPHTDCTWIVRPSTLAPPPDPDGASPTLPPSPPDDGGITLVFERFDTVFDDDFLYVTDPDASEAVPARPRELALYTGALPVPFAVRFDAVAALTLRFVAGDNRDEGFALLYLADGSCHNDCAARGRCVRGLCACDDGWIGSDCTVPLPTLVGDGAETRGVVGVGETRYFRVVAPAEPKNLMLKLEMTFPDGDSDGARPLLMLANATGRVAPKDDDVSDSNVSNVSNVSPVFFDGYGYGAGPNSTPGGDCGGFPGCHWTVARADARPAAPTTARHAGPTCAYRLGGRALVDPAAAPDGSPFPLRDVVFPALPTFHYHAAKAYRAWDLHEDTHVVYAVNEAHAASPRGDAPVATLVPGEWIVGVTNPSKIPLPGFLATAFRARPGFTGASNPAAFILTATLSANANDICPRNCSGKGQCDAGTCRCARNVVGDACARVVEPLPLDRTFVPPPLPVGSWWYARVPIRANDETVRDRELVIELAYPRSPDAVPALFASPVRSDGGGAPRTRASCTASSQGASQGVPGPYGDVHCRVTGYDAAFRYPPDVEADGVRSRTVSDLEAGMDYVAVVAPPEARLVDDGDGYFVGVLNRPHVAASALRFEIRAGFPDPNTPRCPFDCLGKGTCAARSSRTRVRDETNERDANRSESEGMETRARRPSRSANRPATSPDAIFADASSAVACVCPPNATGAFCQDRLAALPVGSNLTRTLANGDWEYFAVDPATLPAGERRAILVELRKTEPDAFPMLFVKRGGIPAAFSAVFDRAEREATVALDEGLSVSVLGSPRNVRVNLTGAVPPGARVVGVRYHLTLTPNAPSFASEACFAFETNVGYAAVTCPSSLDASSATEVVLTASVADSNANPHPVAFDVGDDGALVLELFEGYDDRNAASGDAEDAADATWEGNLTVAYRTRLGVGYDFRDAASTRCAGVECAVEDDHEVVFPVARDDTETFYVGVHNARVGTPGGTLGPRERARFDAPMTYEIRAVASSEDAPACFRACRGRGACVFGTAPACACDDGFFGVSCGIHPERRALALDDDRDDVGTGFLDEGRFAYYALDVPRDARTLEVTLEYPAHVRARPRVFLKRDTVPTYCGSVSGAVAGCEDDFDASDADGEENGFPGGESNTTWLPDGTARTSRTTRVDPRARGGPFVGRVGRAARDVTSVAAAINRERFPVAKTTNAIDRERRPGDDDTDGKPRRWYVAVHNDASGRGAVAFALRARASSSAPCPAPECGGRGTCDETTGSCACDPGYFGRGCAARVDTLAANAAPALVAPLALGEFVFFRFEVNCEGQDVRVALRKGASDANRTRDDDAVAEIELAVRRGALPTIDDGGFLDGVVAAADEDDATIELVAVEPGAYYVVAHVSAGAASPPFRVALEAEGSKIPDRFNECRHADGRLIVEIEPANATTYELSGPAPGDVVSRPPDFFEPAYGACGDDVRSCYLGDAHSSGRVADLPQAFGRGPVRGRVVLARSAPRVNDRRYHYVYGDVRKREGSFDGEGDGDDEARDGDEDASARHRRPASSPPRLMFQGEKDDDRNWDVEACGALVNADEMRGAVCVAARGSCFFSQKTLACQRAGAVAAIIVNTDFAEGAADNWVGSHDPSDISIPTVSLGGEEGNRLLRRMFDPDVADEPNATVDARAYARTVTARLYAYECRARARCPRCAPGFADTSNECASARCPGMDDARTRNCSGRGVGPGGGCRLVRSAEGADPSAIEPAFACACAEGYEGVACERRREDRPVAAKSAGFRAQRDGAKSADDVDRDQATGLTRAEISAVVMCVVAGGALLTGLAVYVTSRGRQRRRRAVMRQINLAEL